MSLKHEILAGGVVVETVCAALMWKANQVFSVVIALGAVVMVVALFMVKEKKEAGGKR